MGVALVGCPSHTSSIFVRHKFAHLKFTVYRKHVRAYTHTHAQCSLASVGLAQARPKYFVRSSCTHQYKSELKDGELHVYGWCSFKFQKPGFWVHFTNH